MRTLGWCAFVFIFLISSPASYAKKGKGNSAVSEIGQNKKGRGGLCSRRFNCREHQGDIEKKENCLKERRECRDQAFKDRLNQFKEEGGIDPKRKEKMISRMSRHLENMKLRQRDLSDSIEQAEKHLSELKSLSEKK